MHSVIYSADNKFQVIGFVKGKSDKGWIRANEMSGDGTMKRNKIEHYDVRDFKSIDDMNEWIMEQVQESRM